MKPGDIIRLKKKPHRIGILIKNEVDVIKGATPVSIHLSHYLDTDGVLTTIFSGELEKIDEIG